MSDLTATPLMLEDIPFFAGLEPAALEALAAKAGEATDKEDVYLFHGDCLADAEKCAAIMREKYGVRNVHLGYIGSVVGSHVGPGALVLGMLGEKR